MNELAGFSIGQIHELAGFTIGGWSGNIDYKIEQLKIIARGKIEL